MFWAERMESLGVGSAVNKLTTAALSQALIDATRNERQIAKAKVVGESIRQEDGVQQAIESIYRDLEYAKSLIKPLPVKSNPLERIVSASLQSLRSTGSSVIELTRRHSREPSTSTDQGTVSDESWSVVSETTRSRRTSLSRRSSSRSRRISSTTAQDSETEDETKHHSLGNLFGSLAHRLSSKHDE